MESTSSGVRLHFTSTTCRLGIPITTITLALSGVTVFGMRGRVALTVAVILINFLGRLPARWYTQLSVQGNLNDGHVVSVNYRHGDWVC
jgi:hypothetical protein